MRNAAHRVAVAVLAMLTVALGLLPVTQALAQGRQRLPAGTIIRIRVDTDIRSSSSSPGDSFGATVLIPVLLDGEEAIPRGSTISGSVLSVQASKGSFGSPSGVTLRIDSITSPTGASIDVVGTLADRSGRDFTTVDNLVRGSEISFRTSQPVRIPENFSGRDQSGGGPAGTDIVTSATAITQLQTVLRDLGFYNDAPNGRLTTSTREAITAFQRDQRLSATGVLDQQTLNRLGLVSDTGGETVAVNVIAADATLQGADRLNLRIAAQTNGPNWQVFEHHFRQADTLHVYVRGTNSGRGPRTLTEKVVTLLLPQAEWQGLNTILVHSSGRDISITSDRFAGSSSQITADEAALLERQISAMLMDYTRQLGVRYTPSTGQFVLTRRTYGENAIELLFALNALSSSARLYSQILRSTTDPDALKGATDLFVGQANAIDRTLARVQSGRAAGVVAAWAPIRDTFQRMETTQGNTGRGGAGSR